MTALAVPPHSELEGVALHDGTLYFCDEANAAVYSAHLGDEQKLAVEPERRSIEARELIVQGVRVQGNKIGFEGIEVSPDGRLLYVLLERSGDEASGCSAKIYRQRNRKGYLELEEDPLEVVL
ncbi:MAG: esterase-like activity of phytase family protein, partial [Acidobacteria bacterium]|nr:esterase-like activity of phytase family protein [Acidobacteriota bacterium]